MKTSNFVLHRFLMILEKKDRVKSLALVVIRIGLSFIDLLGVALFGVLGALAINGSASRAPGDRVSKLLEFLRIDQESIQSQAMIIGVLAAFYLVFKTLLSIFLTRRTMFFLSRRGALIAQTLISKLFSRSIQEVQKRSMQENVHFLNSGDNNITTRSKAATGGGKAVKKSEKAQDTRTNRIVIALLESPLLDVFTVYKDILLNQFGVKKFLVNRDLQTKIEQKVIQSNGEAIMNSMPLALEAKVRLQQNSSPNLSMVSLLLDLRVK